MKQIRDVSENLAEETFHASNAPELGRVRDSARYLATCIFEIINYLVSENKTFKIRSRV